MSHTLKAAKALNEAAAARFPLVKSLIETFGLSRPSLEACRKARSAWPRSPRCDLVSEKLCDDVIAYLAPTLEQHKGCSIIDVHPGACLWSSKLHDFLKPKHHLLMEPEQKYYEPYIKPLLEKRGSTYRHTSLTGAHPKMYWENYAKILKDPALLPPRPDLAHDDPRIRQFDPSLLVIGNLWRYYNEPRMSGNVQFASLILQHMTYACLSNEMLQASGLVRMLWWAPESPASPIVPVSAIGRKAFSIGLDMGAEINQVAASSVPETDRRYRQIRITDMEQALTSKVVQRMQAAGMHQPKNRDFLRVADISADSDGFKGPNPVEATCSTIEELEEAIQAFRNAQDRALKIIFIHGKVDTNSKLRAGNIAQAMRDLAYPQLATVIDKSFRYTQSSYSPARLCQLTTALDIMIRVVNLEANLAAVKEKTPDAEGLDRVRKVILDLGDDLDRMLHSKGRQKFLQTLSIQSEEVHNFYASPPVLARDRRPYEPLRVEALENWPHHPLTLFDVVPRSRDLSVPDIANRKEGARTCQALLRYIFQSPTQPLPTILTRIAPNAAQDLIPEIPGIDDPRKGGRLNPKNVKIRMMTIEMVEGLTRAFLEWPFRPPAWEIEIAAGEGGHTDGEEDTGLEQSVMLEGLDTDT